MKKHINLFEKKLGAYYLVECRRDDDFFYIQLYKKWSKWEGYEATGNIIKIDGKNKDKALSIYKGINLKNMYKEFERNR